MLMATTTANQAPDVTSSAPSGPRIMASVQRQYWDSRDCAHDAAQRELFDVTDAMTALPMSERLRLRDNSERSDDLFLDAADAGTVTAWAGPFYVHVQDAVLDHALETEPLPALIAYGELRRPDRAALAAHVTRELTAHGEELALDDQSDRPWEDVRCEHQSRAHAAADAANAGGLPAQIQALLQVSTAHEVRTTIDALSS